MNHSHTPPTYAPGLEGIIAAETTLSSVDGQRGELTIAGFALDELAGNASYEEAAYLLWHGEQPAAAECAAFGRELADLRSLPADTHRLLRAAAERNLPAMDALRMAVGTFDLDLPRDRDAYLLANALLARVPTAVAAYWRLLNGQEPLDPTPDLGHAANYLYILQGKRPQSEAVRALDTYLVSVIDHGLNASTFTARTIIATGSDLTSAVTGAVGALKGPKHGGAPGPALDMVFAIGSAERAESYLRDLLERGERLMGFGHRVYKVRDPRADVLDAAAAGLYAHGDNGQAALYSLARAVEKQAVALLEEYKPGRNLQTNVEFYTALLLHGLGLPAALFTPTFAAGRMAGWIAHCLEQQESGRLIRPSSRYVGPAGRKWVPLAERGP